MKRSHAGQNAESKWSLSEAIRGENAAEALPAGRRAAAFPVRQRALGLIAGCCALVACLLAGGPVARAGMGPEVSIVPTSLNFGDVPIGTNSSPMSFTLTNVGTNTFRFVKYAVTGKQASDFSQTSTCPPTLAPGDSCSFTVIFNPSALGQRFAHTQIAESRGGMVATQFEPLTGTGVP